MSEYIWAFLRAGRRLCSLCESQERGPHPSSSPGRELSDPLRSLYKSGVQIFGGTRKGRLSPARGLRLLRMSGEPRAVCGGGSDAIPAPRTLTGLDPAPQLVPPCGQV